MKYAIDRTMSPMMIAEYKRLLVPETVMKKSLEEYCAFMKQSALQKKTYSSSFSDLGMARFLGGVKFVIQQVFRIVRQVP